MQSKPGEVEHLSKKYVHLILRYTITIATFTVKINTRSQKARYLLGLINELSKNDKGITVLEEKSEFMKSLDQSFKELHLAKEGKIKLKSAREVLEEL